MYFDGKYTRKSVKNKDRGMGGYTLGGHRNRAKMGKSCRMNILISKSFGI
jgi:hypothetical protein